MRELRLACVLCLLLATAAIAQDAPSPKAPAETTQFAFMVGNWNCDNKAPNEEGNLVPAGTAQWNAWFILDGWAIQDEWIQIAPNGAVFKGTNIRSFNPSIGKWECRWLPLGSLQWRHYTAEKVGDTMVMTMLVPERDANGLYIDRNVFHHITKDSWKWRKDRSYDGGKTWNEGVLVIEATRAK